MHAQPTHLRDTSTPASCSATTGGGSSLFFMWLHAWNCWLMHTRNRKEEVKASATGGSSGERARKRAAGAAAGLNTCVGVGGGGGRSVCACRRSQVVGGGEGKREESKGSEGRAAGLAQGSEGRGEQATATVGHHPQ